MSTLPKKSENKIDGYHFEPKGHKHWFGNKRLTGVTTILGVVSKGDALINWAANQAVDYVKDNSSKADEGTYLVTPEVLENARKAHQRKKEEAGQKGTDVHAVIEEIVKEAIKDFSGVIQITEHELPQVNHFVKWANENKVKFLESEKSVYSQKMFVGGIVDFICEIDGKKWIGDLKTGSGIYAEAFWQMAAYEMLLEEMGEIGYNGYVVLNLKKDGKFAEARSIANTENKEAFLACLKIYRIQQSIKEQL